MNEEAKRSMVEWQEKLDKVTKDSEERISELQQKLAKVSNTVIRERSMLFTYDFSFSNAQRKPKFVQERECSSYPMKTGVFDV